MDLANQLALAITKPFPCSKVSKEVGFLNQQYNNLFQICYNHLTFYFLFFISALRLAKKLNGPWQFDKYIGDVYLLYTYLIL